MNKWKGSLGMKAAAWICITLCGILFFGSAVGAAALWDNDYYRSTEAEIRERAFSSIANRYSMMALKFMKDEREYDWNETNFRYGIIQADDIRGMDFNDPNIYVERNFTEEVAEKDLYMISQEMSENTEIYYSEMLFGGYGIGGWADHSTESIPITNICYNRQNGIFYYETAGGFFPVFSVTLRGGDSESWQLYEFAYDYERGMYRNLTVSGWETTEGMDEAALEDDVVYMEQILAGMSVGEILWSIGYVTFDMFDGTEWNIDTWEVVTLDDTQYLNDGNVIRWVNDTYMKHLPVTEEDNYYTDGESLYVSHGAERTQYWVVSILPENVGTDWHGDLFEQANMIVTLGWSMRYLVFAVMVLSFGVGVALFVFLMCGAGHRKNQEEIVSAWLDKVPFDLYIGLTYLAEILLFMLADEASMLNSPVQMFVFGMCILCMCWVLLLTLLTFAVRVKLGKWWQNTIIWHICSLLGRGASLVYRNLSIFGRAVVVMGVLAFLEFAGIYITWDTGRFGVLFLLWLFEKVLLTGVVFVAVLQMKKLKEGGIQLAEGNLAHRIDTSRMFWEFKEHGESLNSISVGMGRAVDERMKSERFKTELITNVSHDIKTPLTSIVNYVDLLGKEELENENAAEYVEVLKRQSARLKKLIEDLMEASKASTGNLAVNPERLEAGVSMVQTVGEFEEKLEANELELLIRKPEDPVYILADSRHFWRVIDNLMNNICKYAQPHTRVYINLERQGDRAVLTFRNTSKYPLNITSEELMERFVRGDSSRTTEGSGLGLSIARSLMELMGGSFELYVDGDLFKVVLGIPVDV